MENKDMENKIDDENARGRIMLLSVGIFMIIVGASNIISYVTYVIQIVNITDNFSLASYFGEFGLEFFNFLSNSIYNAISVIVGIIGVVFSSKPRRANICIASVIIMITLSFLTSLFLGIYAIGGDGVDRLGMLINGVGMAAYMTITTSSALPVLYLIGAILNKRSIDKGSSSDSEKQATASSN